MEKQVNVLISAYNGEKYIVQQLESIWNQTYRNIKIYVRDDGSTDGTVPLLEQYEKEGRLVLIRGSNLKWGRSFLSLLKAADQGDYWAFSDQDDIWYPDKIQWAVEWLQEQEKQDEDMPLLFHSAYELVNEDLSEVTGTYDPPDYRFDFRRSLTDCLYQGFSIVLNKKLREYMLQADIARLSSHDWWACLLVTQFGKSCFDPRYAARHRRLSSSMSGGDFKSKLKWFRSTFSEGNEDIRSCAREFIKAYGMECSKEDLRYAQWFAGDNRRLRDSLCMAFYPKRWRAGLVSEISMRILMLLGKI